MAKHTTDKFYSSMKNISARINPKKYMSDLKRGYDKYAPRNQTFEDFQSMWAKPADFYNAIKSWGDAPKGTVYSTFDPDIRKIDKENRPALEKDVQHLIDLRDAIREGFRINVLEQKYTAPHLENGNMIETYPEYQAWQTQLHRLLQVESTVMQYIHDAKLDNEEQKIIDDIKQSDAELFKQISETKDMLRQYNKKIHKIDVKSNVVSALDKKYGLYQHSDVVPSWFRVYRDEYDDYYHMPRTQFIADFISERVKIYTDIIKQSDILARIKEWDKLSLPDRQKLIVTIIRIADKKLGIHVNDILFEKISVSGRYNPVTKSILFSDDYVNSGTFAEVISILVHEHTHAADHQNPNMGILGEQLADISSVYYAGSEFDEVYDYSLLEQCAYAIGDTIKYIVKKILDGENASQLTMMISNRAR